MPGGATTSPRWGFGRTVDTRGGFPADSGARPDGQADRKGHTRGHQARPQTPTVNVALGGVGFVWEQGNRQGGGTSTRAAVWMRPLTANQPVPWSLLAWPASIFQQGGEPNPRFHGHKFRRGALGDEELARASWAFGHREMFERVKNARPTRSLQSLFFGAYTGGVYTMNFL